MQLKPALARAKTSRPLSSRGVLVGVLFLLAAAIAGWQGLLSGDTKHLLPPPSVQGRLASFPPSSVTCLSAKSFHESEAYATIYTESTSCYDLSLGVFLLTFHLSNSSRPMLVLHPSTVQISLELRNISRAIIFVPVPSLVDLKVQPRLRAMAMKFHLWRLTCLRSDTVARAPADPRVCFPAFLPPLTAPSFLAFPPQKIGLLRR